MLKTINQNSWAINCDKIEYDGITIVSSEPHNNIPGAAKNIEFAPELPYLYMPLADFSHWGFYLISYVYNTTSGFKLNCDKDVDGEGYSYCRFDVPCDTIPLKEMVMHLKDSDGTTFTHITKSTNFLVDGENFGHNKD